MSSSIQKHFAHASHLIAKNEQRYVAVIFLVGLAFVVAGWTPDIWHFIRDNHDKEAALWWQELVEHWPETSRNLGYFLFTGSAYIAVILAYLRLAGTRWDDFVALFVIRRHTIICGMSTRGKTLAQDIAEHHKGVLMVELAEKHLEMDEQRIRGVYVIQGDAKDQHKLREVGFLRATNLVCMSDSDATNLAILDAARKLAKEAKTVTGHEPEVNCLCHIGNPNLRAHLEQLPIMASKVKGARFRLFSIADITAAELLRCHPPERHVPRERQAGGVHVALFGGESFALGLAVQMAQQCHYWREDYTSLELPKARLTIVADDGEATLEIIRHQCQNIDQLLDLQSAGQPTDSPEAFLEMIDFSIPVSMFYVAQDDEISTLTLANQIVQSLQRNGRNAKDRVVAIIPARANRIDPLAWNSSGNVKVFESYKNCVEEVVIGSARDVMAKAAHDIYLSEAIGKGKKIGERPALREWSDLSEFVRDSNRQQVAHMDVKLRAIGLGGWEIDRTSILGDLPALGDRQLEQLADMEHRRWMAFHYVRGWTYAEKINEETRSHNCLKPYCQLTHEIQEYDRDTVRGMGALCRAAGFGLKECVSSPA